MTNDTAEVARTITRASSKQSYYTARLMVDHDLEFDCYRAYAYFRWVDDVVDIDCQTKSERQAFIQRQKDLVECLYRSENPDNLSREENILADLIFNDCGESNLLRSYIRNFLAIIEFDAERKGRLISQSELDWYASTLGKAVTDGIQHFVCNGHSYPNSDQRYLAATGAHIAHMLRDMLNDIRDGYINIPQEQVESSEINFEQMDGEEIREWVKGRVQLARKYFADGRGYLDQLTVLRCRIVGHWYCARFETLLDTIEADGYILRQAYPKSKSMVTWLKLGRIALAQTWKHAAYHLKNGSGLCGWSHKRGENVFDIVPEYE